MTQIVIDNPTVLTTPELMMQAIDDNFDELYSGTTASSILTKLKTVDGKGSGLDADSVDGYSSGNANLSTSPHLPIISAGGVLEVGRYIDFHHTIGNATDYDVRLHTDGSTDGKLYIDGSEILTGSSVEASCSYGSLSVADYGAVGDGITDDSTAIQNCIDAAQAINYYVEFEPFKNYKLSTGLILKHGKNSTDTMSYQALIKGNMARLKPASGITAITVTPRCLLADVGSGREVAFLHIKDLILDGSASITCKAMQIGAAGKRLDGFNFNTIDNVRAEGFNNTRTWVVTEARNFKYTGLNMCCGGFVMEALTNDSDSFCGDTVFVGCSFNGNGNTKIPIYIYAAAGAKVRGVHFNHCYIYNKGTKLTAVGTSAQVGDIWFDGCQFDAGASGTFFEVSGNGASEMFKIFVTNGYFVYCQGFAVLLQSDGTSVVKDMNILGCNFSEITSSQILHGLRLRGATFANNRFEASSCIDIINCTACQNMMISNNVASNMLSATYGISSGDTRERTSILGNMMECGTIVNNWGTVPTYYQAANNLAI